MEVAILALSILVSAITGFFVFARNPKSRINRIYALLTVSLIIFSVANYQSLATVDRLFYIRTVIFFSTVVVACLYYFIVFLDNPNKVLSRRQRLGIYATCLVAFIDFTPLVFSGLQGTANPVPVPNYGAALFFAHLLFFLVSSFAGLIRRIVKTKRLQRMQFTYLLIGASPIILLAPVTGFVIPVLFENPKTVVLTPIYGAFFVCLVGYTIVKHRLFDIHFFVVRAAAYLTTLFVMTLLLVAPIVVLLGHFLGFHPNLSQLVATVLVSVIILYVLQYLRQVFDRLTNKVFFRHYYDPQDVLDKLSDVLVRTADISALQDATAAILKDAIKPGQFKYVLFNDGAESDARFARQIAKQNFSTATNIVDIDEIGVVGPFITKLKEDGVSLLIKLRTTHEDLGFILLGHKQSGEIYSDRDIRLLSLAADEIAISMQNALRFEEIQRFNETLQQRVKEATHRLSESNKKLKAMDETKDDFIGMASHQLRTPLTSVKGYLSLVLEGDAGKITSQQRKLLTQAFISSQRMVFLIADLLNVSRLKTGKFVIESAAVNLADMVMDEVNQLKETAAARELTLEFHKPVHFPTLELDETKTRQVVMNFLDNAVYYTPSGGKIAVTLTETPKSIELRVTDNGIGVPKSEQHHLFSKFYRAKNAQKARPDGTGLGLFMAKKVVIAQGGAIIFDSKEGKGSTFGFIFPKKRAAAPIAVDEK